MKERIHPKTLAGEIIMFLSRRNGEWATWGTSFYMPTVQGVFPVGTSEKAQLRYMQMLQKKGLVSGCDCGCRGDYTPTEKGLDFLANECLLGRQEKERFLKEGHSFGY